MHRDNTARIAHEDSDNEEKRTSVRRRVLKAGKVVLASGSVYDCSIRNISDDGAQIRIVEPIPLPQSFSIFWIESSRIRPCENRWQRGLDCGVRFTGPARISLRDFVV